MITATTKQQHYLKQFAALQFPGSIETHGTIHVLEQQIPREAGDFYPIMEFIQNAGESLLADELFDRFKIKTTMIWLCSLLCNIRLEAYEYTYN